MTGPSFSVQHSMLMCVVWGLWFLWLSLADQGGCRRLKFVSPVDGKRLVGHVIFNLSTGKYTPCEHRCLMESRCVSVNIGPSMEDNKFVCELNDADHLQYPDHLKDIIGWRYRATENPCSSNPCFHNGTCVNGYSYRGFVCSCLAWYTGEQCEKDIDECKEGNHDCHKDATCINTAGHFNCSCNPGHKGNGRQCSDIDECATRMQNCSVNAFCKNTKGSYNCTCNPGYYGDGRDCPQVFSSCKEIYDNNISNDSKTYPLIVDNEVINVYCHMTMKTTGNGVCGDGGWTLIMKTDGAKSTFHYDSSFWSNKKTFNLTGGETGIDKQETKLPTYWNTSFSKICLGMEVNGQVNFVVIHKQARSLYSLIADGKYHSTSLGRNAWKTLLGSEASLQINCNKEGFNVLSDRLDNAKARIGILGNNENECYVCDSRIGFGTGGAHDNSNTCGNEAQYSGDNGDKHIKAMGYIFVQ